MAANMTIVWQYFVSIYHWWIQYPNFGQKGQKVFWKTKRPLFKFNCHLDFVEECSTLPVYAGCLGHIFSHVGMKIIFEEEHFVFFKRRRVHFYMNFEPLDIKRDQKTPPWLLWAHCNLLLDATLGYQCSCTSYIWLFFLSWEDLNLLQTLWNCTS